MRTDQLTPNEPSDKELKKVSPVTTATSEEENNRSLNNNMSKDSLKLD